MIKKYEYSYNWGDASASLEIDTEKLSADDAKLALNFFTWDYDKDDDPYDELGRLYSIAAMRFATCNDHNTRGVISDFAEAEGFVAVDGSMGITLISADGIDFSDIELDEM